MDVMKLKELFILLDDFCREERSTGVCEDVNCENCYICQCKQDVRQSVNKEYEKRLEGTK